MMRLLVLTAAMALTAVIATAESNKVTVFLVDNAGVPIAQRGPATGIAGRMFRDIGVEIEWKMQRTNGAISPGAILIEFRSFTSDTHMPGALAYAQPFEGTHIVLFWDRIKHRAGPIQVLAHVMAHEIGHILQGVMRHAETGVMKSSWTLYEYGQMHYKPLTFTAFDIELIQKGMAARSLKQLAESRDPAGN